MNLRTCVDPSGRFIWGVHKPGFRIENFRENDALFTLGKTESGEGVENHANFPQGAINETDAGWIYEVPNAFPFRGVTYIIGRSADGVSANPRGIALPETPRVSLLKTVQRFFPKGKDAEGSIDSFFRALPAPLRLAVATSSTDPEDLIRLSRTSCRFVSDPKTCRPCGLFYTEHPDGRRTPVIFDPLLFEAVANNPHLPDDYKAVMVLRPGVQGNSEIVGEWGGGGHKSHIYEYLRRNSYIPWGHFAANMAHDAVRYRIADLKPADLFGLRHLYYQRTLQRVAGSLDIPCPSSRSPLSVRQMEALRCKIRKRIGSLPRPDLPFTATLWGWNFGFDYAPSRYRLHASHQQIHQQYALVPAKIPVQGGPGETGRPMPSYACGDLVQDFGAEYYRKTRKRFFDCYLDAIRNNVRIDGSAEKDRSLIVLEHQGVILFVPKAQTSQWELQIMPVEPVGNILEADTRMRRALDETLLAACRILEAMGARLITGLEFSKRFDSTDTDQRLLYSFLPRLPESPGAFSESQLRWITPHYPEDFAAACRARLPEALSVFEQCESKSQA